MILKTHLIEDWKDRDPNEFIGYIFKNDNGAYSVLKTLDDILKSNGWFGAKPHHLFLFNDKGDIMATTDRSYEVPSFATGFLRIFTYDPEVAMRALQAIFQPV